MVLLLCPLRSAIAETYGTPSASNEHATEIPKSIVELQFLRTETRAPIERADGTPGIAILINLNPNINAWYLLTLAWVSPSHEQHYHLESPTRERLHLLAGDTRQIRISRDSGKPCLLWNAEGGGELETASTSGLPYAPICADTLYLRNPVDGGHHASLQRITDFLRDRIWGGDAFLEKPAAWVPFPGASAQARTGPLNGAVTTERAIRSVVPPRLALILETKNRALQPGEWYPVRGLEGVFAGIVTPEDLAPEYLAREDNVNSLDSIEASALVYLVAFDLTRFDLHFALGSEDPRLNWSPRPPPVSRDAHLPGPDGVGSAAPLVLNGMVSPADAGRTVATFAGGFKRAQGAFRSGPLAVRNHGSHYGFLQEGVILSKLQPDLATALVMSDGAVELRTWHVDDEARLPSVRYARQNGVPLLEFDPTRAEGVPGRWVNQWGPGNWSGSEEEDLRTLRAGMCLQEFERRRYLLYGYFSTATPSAMARVFQAYHCRYAMHLDMNALQHTYLAMYVRDKPGLLVEHLITGMEEVDRTVSGVFAPRFLAFPDDRDFFYLTRRKPFP